MIEIYVMLQSRVTLRLQYAPPPPKLKETFDHYQNFAVNTCILFILKIRFFNFLTDILQLSGVSESQTEEES